MVYRNQGKPGSFIAGSKIRFFGLILSYTHLLHILWIILVFHTICYPFQLFCNLSQKINVNSLILAITHFIHIYTYKISLNISFILIVSL